MKTILITGAAHGIGLATAKQYAAQGWFVGMYDINREGLAALMESGDIPNACGDYCDVTDIESLRTMLAHFSAQTNGRIDLFVNNALQLAFPLLKQTHGATVVNQDDALSS